MNKQQLAAKIWESANKMRSKIEANEYKDYILGFIFYKYLSEAEKKFVFEQGGTEEELKSLSETDKGNADWIKNAIGYFISYDNFFSTWIEKGNEFTVGNVNDSMNAFSRNISENHKKVFNEIFTVLRTGLGKLGDTPASQSKAIRELIVLINDIPMDKKQDYDVLGFIYEYLISQFAANAGKKAGEFYTPHEVSLLMSEIVANHLKNKEKIAIYDPTSGSGSLLINIGKSIKQYGIKEDNISYYAQELKVSTYNLTRMNLVMRGININNIFVRNADTLESDWPIFNTDNDPSTYSLLRVDAVVSNPPYSQNWDPTDKKTDKRYKDFGVAPKSKADYAFLLHDLYHLVDDGIMTIVLPHGVLFRGGEEGEIRKNLIEKNHIDAIIGLPANIFFGTGIPTIIMVLKRQRDNDDTLIIDASKHFTKEGKNNVLKASDIKRIVDTVKSRKNIEKFSRCVSRNEIRGNDYNLNIPRYVDSSEEAENFDIYASMYGGIPQNELKKFDNVFAEITGLKNQIFDNYDSEYVNIKETATIKELVFDYAKTKDFIAKFTTLFENLSKFLDDDLIANYENCELGKEESIIGDKIFDSLENETLINKYAAYQLLDDQWHTINDDLETIQREGFECTKQVDPNNVLKIKDNEEIEVQDGWKGHILPFDLVQSTYLTKETEELQAKKLHLEERESEITELVEKLSETDEGQRILNEDNTELDSKLYKAKVKEIKQEIKKNKTVFEDDSIEKIILNIEAIYALMKTEAKDIEKSENELHNKTKTTIETLTDEQVKTLLNLKWIKPLIDALNNLPQEFLNNFVQSVEKIQNKYKDNLNDLETQINETSSSLCSMIGDLTGSDFDMKGLSELKSLLMGN